MGWLAPAVVDFGEFLVGERGEPDEWAGCETFFADLAVAHCNIVDGKGFENLNES